MSKLARMTGKDFQEKHAAKLKAASDDIRKGVDALTKSPGISAAESADIWKTRMTDSEVQNRWERNVSKVTLEDWKKDMKDKGIGRISAGLDRAKDKIADFGSKLLSFQKGAVEEFKEIKPLTLDEAADKAAKWVKKMGEFSYKK